MISDPFFFGYGSLVNRQTHAYDQAHRACAHGWRRLWRHAEGRDVAILTAVPSPGTEIEGLIAAVPGADWAALDLREEAYDRLPASGAVRHPLDPATDIAIYSIPEDKHQAAAELRPILLSYLDVVVQGYHREFGDGGVQRFFATTDGWEAPVLDDRAAPRYPRAQALSRAEVALVDRHLDHLGSRRMTA